MDAFSMTFVAVLFAACLGFSYFAMRFMVTDLAEQINRANDRINQKFQDAARDTTDSVNAIGNRVNEVERELHNRVDRTIAKTHLIKELETATNNKDVATLVDKYI
jgi:F0F1-type ATP synthase membrane subunit b/b'